jgi:RHS repeat-associated protein
MSPPPIVSRLKVRSLIIALAAAFIVPPSAFAQPGGGGPSGPPPVPKGAARRWHASMPVSPYNSITLRTGRLFTTLPIVGWSGRGPSVSFALYHNMNSAYGEIPVESGGSSQQFITMGDADGDGGLTTADVDPFVDILLSAEPTAGQLAVSDFDMDETATIDDADGFFEALSSVTSGPEWRHSYMRCIKPGGLGKVKLVHDDGREDVFSWNVPGPGQDPPPPNVVYASPPGVFDTLTDERDPNNTWIVLSYTLTHKDQSVTRFLGDGRLDYVADATVALDAGGKPHNRVQCSYIDNSEDPADGKLDYVDDAAGRRLDLHYNAYGRLCRIGDPVERAWRLVYNDILDPEGIPTPAEIEADPDCEQDVDGYFVALQDPAGNRIHVAYTEDFDIAWITDKNEEGYVFTYADGRVAAVDDPLGIPQTFTYFGTLNNELVTRFFDRRGNEWKYTFDTAKDNIESVRNPLGGQGDTYAYDAAGGALKHEVTTRTNALGKEWQYSYDGWGNLLTATLPTGEVWTLTYELFTNNLTSIKSPDDIQTFFQYDADAIDPSLMTRINLPPDQSGATAKIDIDYWAEETVGNARGKLKSVRDANDVETVFRYDTKGGLGMIIEGPMAELGTWEKVFDFFKNDGIGRVTASRRFGLLDTNSEAFGSATAQAGCAIPTPCPGTSPVIVTDACGCPIGFACQCVEPHWPPCPEEEGGSCSAAEATSTSGEPPASTLMAALGGCPLDRFGFSGKGVAGPLGSANLTRDNMDRVLLAEAEFADDTIGGGQSYFADQSVTYDGIGRVLSTTLVTDEPRGNASGGGGAELSRAFTYDYDDVNGTFTRTGPDGQATVVETDIAGRVTRVQRGALTTDYTYYTDGQVATTTNANGTVTEYEYDDSSRLAVIRHRQSAGGTILLELVYTYNPRGLIDTITESGVDGTAAVAFDYDQRGRLIEEQRTGTHPYHMAYTYDPGGNRKSKIDMVSGRSTIYHYDVDGEEMVDCNGDGSIDDADTTADDCYNTRNNRLMYEETFVPNPVGVGTLRRNKIYYEYATDDVAVGSPITIVRREYVDGRPEYDPFTPPQMYAMTLDYGHDGELRFLSQFTWPEGDCFSLQDLRIDEFVTSGRAMRVTRQRDPEAAFLPVDGTTTWRDYDGDEIYGDVRIDDPGASPIGTTNTASYVLGVGQVDLLTGTASYHHANQIGTLRAATDHPPTGPATVIGRLVYTAFGEQVHADGTIGTKYEYAGSWGYEAGLYEFVIPETAPDGESPFTGVVPDVIPAPCLHVGHRWYDAATGRFVQRDPIGIAGDLNTYEYSWNSPPRVVDPDGLGGFITGGGHEDGRIRDVPDDRPASDRLILRDDRFPVPERYWPEPEPSTCDKIGRALQRSAAHGKKFATAGLVCSPVLVLTGPHGPAAAAVGEVASAVTYLVAEVVDLIGKILD